MPMRPRSLAVLATLMGLLGCNHPVLFAKPPPHFRGITIPLPPPSLVDAPTQHVDLEGNIGENGSPGMIVHLWRSDTPVGWEVGPADDGDFEFSDVEVTLDQTCIELVFEYDDAGERLESLSAFYQVVTMSADGCADPMLICSEMDAEGSCACLDERNSGC